MTQDLNLSIENCPQCKQPMSLEPDSETLWACDKCRIFYSTLEDCVYTFARNYSPSGFDCADEFWDVPTE